MPAPAEIRETIERYVKLLSAGDVDGVMGLFAEEVSLEDPVGGTALEGADAVRAFYGAMAGKLSVQLTGPIRVAGVEAAFPMLARVELGEQPSEMDVIDVMKFGDGGKVVSMRAFWNPAEMRPVS